VEGAGLFAFSEAPIFTVGRLDALPAIALPR
jgi:hypothetical protein